MPRSGWAVFLLTLTSYLVLAGPTFFWLDSSELVAASFTLGVAHPPGHPLAALLARLCCALPFGNIAFRVTLASALQAALASLLVTATTLRLLRLREAQPRTRVFDELAAGAAGLCAGWSYAVGFQAVRAEVYALNLLLVLFALHELLVWDERGDRRRLLGATLALALGLCNHHLLVLLAGPAVALFVLTRRPAAWPRRPLLSLCVVALLGLAVLSYLPLRASRDPLVNWGSPTTLERFGWVVSARAFQQTVTRVAETAATERVAAAAFAAMSGLTPIGFIAGLGGLYLLARQRRSRRAALLLGVALGGNLAAPMLVGFDPFNPDAHGYLALSIALLAPLCVVFVVTVGEALQATRAWIGQALATLSLLALVGHQALRQLPACDLRRHVAAEETIVEQLGNAPPGALLLTSYFETIFNYWALRTTGEARPDLQVVHRNFVAQPAYLENLARRDATLPRTLLRLRDPHRALPQHELAALGAQRRLLFEPDLNLPSELLPALTPAGLLLSYGGSGGNHAEAIARWEASLTEAATDSETRRTRLWTHYVLARFGCERRLPALYAWHLRHAQRIAPQSLQLRALAARCGAV